MDFRSCLRALDYSLDEDKVTFTFRRRLRRNNELLSVEEVVVTDLAQHRRFDFVCFFC